MVTFGLSGQARSFELGQQAVIVHDVAQVADERLELL